VGGGTGVHARWLAPLTKGVRCRKPPRDYLRNFYFDVLIHDLAARKYLVDWMGADNLVVGDNFGGMDSVDGFTSVDQLRLDAVAAAKIKGPNACQLFKLEGYLEN
jgi:aminocarboxymuconate-semialdehyde decarboxylase